MTHIITINVASNRNYWQGVWIDAHGRRRKTSLGPKFQVSRRQAVKLAQSLANQLNRNPTCTDKRVPRLGSFVDSYIASRVDLKPGTLYLHRLTRKYLAAFFGEQKRLDQISRFQAREWVSTLASGQLTNERPMAPPTVRGHVVNAKAIFGRAVEDDLLLSSPFDRINVPVPKVDKANWHFVTMGEFEQLIAACKTIGWKCLIAFCRLAGLRRGEALILPWSGVDLQRRRLTVFATKTGQKRIVPIVPRLLEILQAAHQFRHEGALMVCEVSHHCLWRNFIVIRERAGLAPWEDAFQTMRRNCETDWAQQFPQYVVSEWLGHDITVSAEHYLSVPQELYNKASGISSLPASNQAAVVNIAG